MLSYENFGKSDLPELNALLILSLLTFSNLIGLVLLLDIIAKTSIFHTLAGNKVLSIIVALLTLLTNYLFVMYKGKYKSIIGHFKHEENHPVKATLLIYCYIIFSLAFLVASFVAYLNLHPQAGTII